MEHSQNISWKFDPKFDPLPSIKQNCPFCLHIYSRFSIWSCRCLCLIFWMGYKQLGGLYNWIRTECLHFMFFIVKFNVYSVYTNVDWVMNIIMTMTSSKTADHLPKHMLISMLSHVSYTKIIFLLLTCFLYMLFQLSFFQCSL